MYLKSWSGRHSSIHLGLLIPVSFIAVSNAWIHAASVDAPDRRLSHASPEPDRGSNSSDDEPDAAIVDATDHVTDAQPSNRRAVFKNFLRFLELGCGGSPAQGYPTLVVILSTIPEEVGLISS